MKYFLIAVAICSLVSKAAAFGLTAYQPTKTSVGRLHRSFPLFAEADENEGGVSITQVADIDESADVKALAPAAASPESDLDQPDVTDSSTSEGKTSSSQVFMITRDTKRTMIEELGYKRKDVDSIRLELVANIIENRVRCPSDGMPVDWVDQDREAANESVPENSSMMQRLENESKYPLKFPLLAVSLILFGKGFSDALITIIKVNISFPGASLTAQFQGIPVLAIDFVCVIAGLGMGLWTYKTMK